VPCSYRYLNFHLAIPGIRTIHAHAIEYLQLRDPDFTPTQRTVREAVSKICTRFPDSYWADLDASHTFPTDFHQAFAKDGWLGICMPSAYGGSDLGIAKAAVMVQTIVESGKPS
jgi:alkylation response protein AidB-like acyl-CoA dehydrogenase